MKRKLSKYRTSFRALMILLVFLPGLTNIVFGQNEYPIKLKSGYIYPEENLASFISASSVSEDEVFQGYYYRFVQFYDIPDTAARNKMTRSGLLILSYLPERTYCVAFPAEFNKNKLNEFGIRSISEIKPEYKVSPLLTRDTLPGWALREGDQIRLMVEYHENLKKQIVKSFMENLGYQVWDRRIIYPTLEIQIPINKINFIASLSFIVYIDPASDTITIGNYSSRTLNRTNTLKSDDLGINFNGEGINIAMGDNGKIGPHIDFNDRFLNLTDQEILTPEIDPEGNHGDHVAGTIMGAGNFNPYYEGHAPGAVLYVKCFDNVIYDVDELYNNQGVIISSNSYYNPFLFGGIYDDLSRFIDFQFKLYPNLSHVFAAGNDGSLNHENGYGDNWNNVFGGFNTAKNVIKVGNVYAFDNIASSSSRGPTDDGRIKPDICAKGTDVISTIDNHEYSEKSGTSMATPAVSGTIACLYQAYKDKNNEYPKSDLIKAILLNSSDDIGNPGPDYETGWGRVNARRALKTVEEERYRFGSFSQSGEGHTYGLIIQDELEVKQLRIMVYWHDSIPNAGSEVILVNDIDLSVKVPDETVVLPLVLNPQSGQQWNPAQNGTDHINNVEQVIVENSNNNNIVSGLYEISLFAHIIAKPPQRYVVVYELITDDITITWPSSGVSLVPNTVETIRWDAYNKSDFFTIYYQENNNEAWNPLPGQISGNLRYCQWSVPNLVSGKVKLKITQGIKADNSQEFSIIGIPQNLETSCGDLPNSVKLTWDEVENATGYEVFKLNDKYMEKVDDTPNTYYSFPLMSLYSSYWVSVRAIGDNNAVGMRAEAIKIDKSIFPSVYIKGAGKRIDCNSGSSVKLTAEAEFCLFCSYTYQWKKDGELIPGATLKEIEVSESGDYCVIVTKSDGCSIEVCEELDINVIDCWLCGELEVLEEICERVLINVIIIRSYDPNEITGPAGYGSEQFVKKDDDLVYTVFFENDPDFATAPAQKVVINMPFDDKANMQSFRLKDFGFGSFTFQVPENKTFYNQRLDVSDSLGVFVDVIAGVDVNTNKAFWIFQAIDTATGLPPTDPMLGFLPVNDTLTGSGEGYVSFRMRPANNTVTGDTLTANANIIFDINEPIFTNTWENRIDALPPSSIVNPLPPVASAATFEISFTGQDDAGGSAIRSYRLYYSENGEPFSAYGEFALDQTATFTGNEGMEYGFFSIAVDNVGNTEPMKTSAETTTILGDLSLQASGIVFSEVDTNSFKLNWTDGNGSKRAVFMRQGATGSAFPANNNTYEAGTVFGSGTQIGSTGWYCLFNGTEHAAGVTITGMEAGETYRVMVCEYLGSTSLEQYLTSVTEGNPADQEACFTLPALISGPYTACLKDGVELTYEYSTRAGMDNYSWTVSGGGTILEGNGSNAIEVGWLTPGVRYVSVSYVDEHSCEAVSTAQLVVMVDTSTIPGMVSGSAMITLGYPTDTLIIEGHRGSVVKWQKRFTGNNYVDIPATTGQVKYVDLPDAPGTWYYRTLVQNDSCFAEYSEPATVQVVNQQIGRSWTGVIDENWHKAGNWNPPGIPRPTEDVIIPSTAPHMPLVRVQGMSCHQIYLSEGATLIINPGMTLVITGAD